MYSSLEFRKSSYSPNESACVEIADVPGTSAVRDTENRHLGYLTFPSEEWAAAVNAVRLQA
ncbi:DUF397 domain-containing protein [Nocardiopsis sp. FIRDI 009]|uniref:DUF397 domain-containing protein n=1 Tax=Nocardiopsis sp. FIRDI 009 TaxID=714197 RepID=UPI001E3B5F19|nr:DUF397 domain-containing protein [Nocardiopsis sp. FIRDI 009]